MKINLDDQKVVKDIKIEKGMTADEIVRELFESGGFTAKKFALAVDILEKMMKEEKIFRFLSFPACIMATGTKGILVELVKRKLFDAIITTCGTLDHDLARLWKPYYHGSFLMDDKELRHQGINRLGNVLVPNDSYWVVEEKLQKILQEIYDEGKRRLATYELIWEIGKRLENEEGKENSLIYWAYKNKIPIFVPGITDGAVGYQIWMFAQDKSDFIIDVFRDESKLDEIMATLDAENIKSSALMLGGGISKHHTIWWNQFYKEGLDYAVYITTAPEWDGSLSGARLREAVSWGKVREDARYVTVEGDVTVLLPFMVAALFERL
ncbi:deoxyhypusine synthase [Palaeococcus pacificus DY20341]|uniref:Probable deoxyhypusine synthase n=1 Tax=Palaeococcus pacificus DY20341 TaxID=1343739 RepID=A0A075LZM6_9EURY|nr:deoxyhypusine synthase [Palaeococcus pacificus]AIF70038.1 deoxyhypusine synthase [Palaeococcus pacificus DY20341]